MRIVLHGQQALGKLFWKNYSTAVKMLWLFAVRQLKRTSPKIHWHYLPKKKGCLCISQTLGNA